MSIYIRVLIPYDFSVKRGIIIDRDIGAIMRLTTLFNVLKRATLDIFRMHDFNYQLPKDLKKDYWEKKCLDHPTSSHCKVY